WSSVLGKYLFLHSLIFERSGLASRVCLNRSCRRYPSVSYLFLATQRVGPVVEKYFQGTFLTFSMQASHVRVHVLSRKAGDFHRNDSVCDEVSILSQIFLLDQRGCWCDVINLMNQVPP
uniref:Uncharacterized protein n=1 Tax=Prolemur simus TaxID=1328070 RepID=A0A8C9DRI8_PROSS